MLWGAAPIIACGTVGFVHPDLERLIRLQALDTRAADARKAQVAIPETQRALDQKLEGARSAVAAAKDRQAANQADRRALEKDLSAVNTRLSRYKDQLMEVKTNREYTAMQHEIETAQGEVKRLEDQMLERMLESDELAAGLKTAEGALKAAEQQIAKERAELDTQLAGEGRALEDALAARAALVAELPASVVSTYESVARGRKGVAVAIAKDERCSQCQVRMRPQVFVQVRMNSGIVQCDSCQRILYYVPPAAAAETASPATA
jgi:predicted  nucleic acid-binding Zn-ribbon protein